MSLPKVGEGKTEIVIHAWHVEESFGGFDWAPTWVPGNLEAFRDAHDGAASIYGATSSTLATLWIQAFALNSDALSQVNEYIEGELQDAIERGLVGRIIDRWSIEDDLPEVGEDVDPLSIRVYEGLMAAGRRALADEFAEWFENVREKVE